MESKRFPQSEMAAELQFCYHCKTHGTCVYYCLSLASLSSELGFGVNTKVVDMDIIYHQTFEGLNLSI